MICCTRSRRRADDPCGAVLGDILGELCDQRRRAYIGSLLLVTAVEAFAWLFRSPGDTYRTISAPFFCLLLPALAWLVWRNRMPIQRLELLIVGVVAAMPLTRQAWLFQAAGIGHADWLRLLGNDYWATSAVLVLARTLHKSQPQRQKV